MDYSTKLLTIWSLFSTAIAVRLWFIVRASERESIERVNRSLANGEELRALRTQAAQHYELFDRLGLLVGAAKTQLDRRRVTETPETAEQQASRVAQAFSKAGINAKDLVTRRANDPHGGNAELFVNEGLESVPNWKRVHGVPLGAERPGFVAIDDVEGSDDE